jgi:hypothetical protein
VAITLTDEEFSLLYEYLDREHSIAWDPNTVGETTKLGKTLWDRIQEVAQEQNFTATHQSIRTEMELRLMAAKHRAAG